MLMQKLDFSCNYNTLKDGRGGILTFLPNDRLEELTLIQTVRGEWRGYHYHKEFDEYILVVSGHGMYLEVDTQGNVLQHFKVSFGDCLYFPSGCIHALHTLTDMRLVAGLTRKWDDCHEPITRIENFDSRSRSK